MAEELPPAVWVLERVDHPKFPYRITITRGEEVVLALRVSGPLAGEPGEHLLEARGLPSDFVRGQLRRIVVVWV